MFMEKFWKGKKVLLSELERERETESCCPSCGSISGQEGDGCKLSSHPLCCIHPFSHPSLHPPIHFQGRHRGWQDQTKRHICAPVYAWVILVCTRASGLWIRWHEELKQNQQKDENAPVSQPQHPLLRSGDSLYDPVTGRLRDLLQHPGRRQPHEKEHSAQCSVIIAKKKKSRGRNRHVSLLMN